MNHAALEQTAQAMIADGKGVLAIDESTPTCGKRLAAVGVDNSDDARRDYRSLLLGAPGLSQYVSGAILYDETIRSNSSDGAPFPKLMQDAGIIPGIKVDTGAKDLAGHPGEKVTEGLDGLSERLAEYHELGARFAKWRAVITIEGQDKPSAGCLQANAHALARYAALCQEAGIVPIVEPEVLYDGEHTIDRCYQATEATLAQLFGQLRAQRVHLPGLILKASMVLDGKDCPQTSDVPTVAEATLRCLKNTVPATVPGVAFLSGGQSEVLATEHLNEINRRAGNAPWKLTFSYARALQGPALEHWRGQPGNVGEAQRLLVQRAALNSAAAQGRYEPAQEERAA